MWVPPQKRKCFNSQPREGGWESSRFGIGEKIMFQLAAARRRLAPPSRIVPNDAGFNSQPREGGWPVTILPLAPESVSTRSRAKAAGCKPLKRKAKPFRFQLAAARRRLESYSIHRNKTNGFNSQPREGGWQALPPPKSKKSAFQLAAARRRLVLLLNHAANIDIVSTRSRAKAAGTNKLLL